jgi:hypothetical protein
MMLSLFRAGVGFTPHLKLCRAAVVSLFDELCQLWPPAKPTTDDAGARLLSNGQLRIVLAPLSYFTTPANWPYPCQPQAKGTLFSGSTRLAPLSLPPLFYTSQFHAPSHRSSNSSHTNQHSTSSRIFAQDRRSSCHPFHGNKACIGRHTTDKAQRAITRTTKANPEKATSESQDRS